MKRIVADGAEPRLQVRAWRDVILARPGPLHFSSAPSSAHASTAMSEKANARRPAGFAQEDASSNAFF